MKNKSIGSLIVLAILAPSCGSGGGGGSSGPKNPPILVKWQTQQRSPTSSDLKGIVATTSPAGYSGIVVGKDGSFFRFDDDLVNTIWTQQEIDQPTLGSHVNAVGANGRILIAAGADLATGFGRSYTGIDTTWWRTTPGGTAFIGDYYNSTNFTNLVDRRYDGSVNFDWDFGPQNRADPNQFSVRWTGKLLSPAAGTETFTFKATTIAADSVRLVLNGTQLFTGTGPTRTGTFSLAPNTFYDFVFEFIHPTSLAGPTTTVTLTWQSPSTPLSVIPAENMYGGAPYVDVNVPFPGIGNVPGNYMMLRSDGWVDGSFAGSGAGFYAYQQEIIPPAGSHIPPTPPIRWTEINGTIFVGGTLTGFFCGKDQGYGGYAEDLPIPPGYPKQDPWAARAQIVRTNSFGNSFINETITASNIDNLYKMFLTQTPIGALHAIAVGVDTSNHGVMLMTNTDVESRWDLADGPTRPTTSPPFRAVHFPIDDRVGYIVGDAGRIYRVTSTYVINPGSPGDPTAVPPIPPVAPFTVYTWVYTQMNSGTAENLTAVSFVNNDVGYAVGDKGTVLRITNGSTGLNWTKISKGDAGVTFNAASFTDNGQKGIAVGNAGKIYRTIDGGLNWIPMASGSGQNLLGAAVPPGGAGTHAFACGAGNTLLRNTDVWGAGAWAPVGTITGAVGTETYQAVLFPQTEANGICIGAKSGSGVVLRTSGSAGNSWAAVTPGAPPAGSYFGLVLNPAGNTLYASGSAGMIAASSDVVNGFTTWSSNIPTPVFPSALTLSSIASPEGAQSLRFVAASDGKVWRETSGAAPAWAATAAPWGAAIPQSLAFQADPNGLVVTNLGGVFTTINGGATWELSSVHSKDKPRAVWMSRTVPGLAYIVADDGTILKTLSGGR
ncbi:MAG TPA: PA14 domain-containing protein [Planctomycetota bacterium]|nr:PA14 domain-containing protein [Planctomycetota bacterium]